MRNSRTPAFMIAAFISLGLLACQKKSDSPPAAERTATPSAASAEERKHAGPGVTPGSHEDWCGEHQVPESQCTRCNPSLTAAFKATGDWCQKHGLPESQCLACSPDLKIERPPRTGE